MAQPQNWGNGGGYPPNSASDEESDGEDLGLGPLAPIEESEPYYFLQAQILSREDIGGTTWYSVQVNVGDEQRLYKKRFNDFKGLHRELQRSHVRLQLPEMPKTGKLGLRHQLNVGHFNEERQATLQTYLDNVMAQIQTLGAEPALALFFNRDRAFSVEKVNPVTFVATRTGSDKSMTTANSGGTSGEPSTPTMTAQTSTMTATSTFTNRNARPARRVGLLGLGAINETVAQALLRAPALVLGLLPRKGDLPDGVDGAKLCAILVTDVEKHSDKKHWLGSDVLLTADPNVFFAANLDVVVEAAGQPTVKSYGERALSGGSDFIVTSTGALADDALFKTLRSAASKVGAGRLHLASGAMAGLDWMQAASIGGDVERVTVVQSKPPASWHGTAAEEAVLAVTDWEAHGPLTIFEGLAREAAEEFPKSSNVTATLALATAGLDKTDVRLVADPAPFFSTNIELKAACGSIKIQVEHRPSASNPKTSADVALSVLRSLRATCSPVCVGT